MPDDQNITQHRPAPITNKAELPICPHCGADPMTVKPFFFRIEPVLNCVVIMCVGCRKALPVNVLTVEHPMVNAGNLAMPNGKPRMIS